MSTFSAPIVEFKLKKHPNADTLSLAQIKGWRCVVRTEDFLQDHCGVYVPLDAVAAKDHPLLSFLEGKKVKTVRLRGELSQGVLLPLSSVVDHYKLDPLKLKVGQDLHQILGIEKWVAPEPVYMRGRQSPHALADRPVWLSSYTDIENWNNFPDVITYETNYDGDAKKVGSNSFALGIPKRTQGEKVIITEKLHGCAAIFARVNGVYYACSKSSCFRTENKTILRDRFQSKKVIKCLSFLRLRKFFQRSEVISPVNNVWNRVFREYDLKEKLDKIAERFSFTSVDRACHVDVAIYGEVVGVQDLMYGLKKGQLAFYAYDLRVRNVRGDSLGFDGRELPYSLFEGVMDEVSIPVAPKLYEGEFKEEHLDLRNGKTTIQGADHCREGIVIRPAEPRTDYKIGRVILKRIGEDYLCRRSAKDY